MKNLLLVAFILLSKFSIAQTVYYASKEDKKNMTLYSCGTTSLEPDSCYKLAEKNYGFTSKDLGCFVNKKIQRRFNKNNKKVERELIQEYGQDWKKKFNKEVEACRAKKL